MVEPITDQWGRKVGYVEGPVYYTVRERSKHYFVKFGSYGISTYVLDKLVFQGVQVVQITEKTNPGERRLFASVAKWRKGRVYVDHGHDEQKHLAVEEMSVDE